MAPTELAMPKRMLIDASHPEETRVVVIDGNRVEEFDFESAAKRPLKGNIYLAKVTRVEPSLQAAFVEYGGNRQGFLAFSEIHPDYYQIPVADRMALIAEAEAEARRRQEDDVESFEITSAPKPNTDDAEDETESELDQANDAEAAGENGGQSARDSISNSDETSNEAESDESLSIRETNDDGTEADEEVFTNHPEQGEEPANAQFESDTAAEGSVSANETFDAKTIEEAGNDHAGEPVEAAGEIGDGLE